MGMDGGRHDKLSVGWTTELKHEARGVSSIDSDLRGRNGD
jgi:hypothetical protein